MNREIRLALGRQVSTQRLAEGHVGSIGVGRGGASTARVTPPTNEQINERIRAAAHLATNRADLGVDLDDVWLGR